MDVRRFAIEPAQTAPVRETLAPIPRHRPGERFLKGPIPRSWLTRVMPLPGKALHVAVEIWFRVGLTGRSEVALSLAGVARIAAFDRTTASRALASLEAAGLVAVRRQVGRAPRVTVLPVASEDATSPVDDAFNSA